jgi:SOS-response transcriptional repressor LexA
MLKLTKGQREVFDYIRRYFDINKKSPCIREVQEGCNIACYKSAVDKLLALEKKELIRRKPNKHRSIIVLSKELL